MKLCTMIFHLRQCIINVYRRASTMSVFQKSKCAISSAIRKLYLFLPSATASPEPHVPGRLRLCQLRQWSDFDGYGFVLVETKSRPGSYVRRVEIDSPAAAGGLRPGDRVVEVNGINVETESHPIVADRIRAVDGCLELLVVDEKSDKCVYTYSVYYTYPINDGCLELFIFKCS